MTKKLLALLCLLCLLAQSGLAEDLYTADELDELVGPVALYPDPLLSNVLTAATQPDQIKQAQSYLDAGKPVTEDMKTGFDTAVNALMFYPDVLSMMNKNTEWTSAIGWATANQLSDVMEAVQRFRYQAKTAGSLKTNDKVKVIEEGTVIRIEPADPQVIYVPTYQPSTVIVQQSDGFDTFLHYSAGIAANVLLWDRVFNYHDYGIYPTPYGWRPSAGYYRPYGGTAVFNRNVNVWAPNRNTVINRPVNISNNQFQNINASNNRVNRTNNTVNRVGNNTRVNNSNRTTNRVGNDNRVQPRNNTNVSQPRPESGRRPGAKPPVRTPSQVTRPNRDSSRASSRPANRSSQRAKVNTSERGRRGMSDYSRTGGTVRSSNRGARSRGTNSHVGGRSGGFRGSHRGGRRR